MSPQPELGLSAAQAADTVALRLGAESQRREKAERDAAAAGPSDRELEREMKRKRMEDEASERMAKPKAPRQQRERTEEEKSLESQNKAIMGDMAASAKQRLSFLLGQSDIFKHFGMGKEAEEKAQAAFEDFMGTKIGRASCRERV